MSKSVLISGASIAGPSLAYWLARYGYDVTVVERAQAIRPGGQAVDFCGEVHMRVLEKMGVLDEIRLRRTDAGPLHLIDAAGRTRVSLPDSFTGGDVEIHRGDLAELLYELTRDSAHYVFGDSISMVRMDSWTKFTTACQRVAGGAGPFFAPKSERALRRRATVYRLLTAGPFIKILNKLTTQAATAIKLKEYPEPSSTPHAA